MFDNKMAGVDTVVDAALEQLLQEVNLDEEISDDVDDSEDVVPKHNDLEDADINDVKLPPEARDYISTLESQTHRLEEELEECDELLMYLPYHSKDSSQAVVLYEDFRELEQSAADNGLTIDEFKQKVLKELAQEDFKEEDISREFDELYQLQRDLDEIRNAVKLERNDEMKAILTNEDGTGAKDGSSVCSERTVLAISDGSVYNEASMDDAGILVVYKPDHCESPNMEAGPLLSVATASSMQAYVLEQLRKTEDWHEMRTQKLQTSIDACKHEEERRMLEQEERKQHLQQIREADEAALMQKLKENERLVEEERKVRDEQMAQELSTIQLEIDELSQALEEEKHQYQLSRKQWLKKLDKTRNQAAVLIQKFYRGHRTRKQEASAIHELNEWKEMRKKEKHKLRLMELEYEIKYREEQAKREREKEEKRAAEEKMKKEEEERQKEIEQKKKEETERIIEQFRREKEQKEREQKLEEERKRLVMEDQRKQEEQRRKEEEKLKKEEEQRRKDEEKKKQKEKEKQKKEEEQKKKEEMKRKKEEEKKVRKEEEKRKKEEERRVKEERELKNKTENEKQAQESSKDNKKLEEGIVMKELNESLEKKSENVAHLQSKTSSSDTAHPQREVKSAVNDTTNSQLEVKSAVNDTTNPQLEVKRAVNDTTNPQHEVKSALHSITPDSEPGAQQQQPLSLPTTSEKMSLHTFVQPPPHSQAAENVSTTSSFVQPLLVTTAASVAPYEFVIHSSKLSPPKPDPVKLLWQDWIKSCIPWSTVSCEPWKLKQAPQKSYKRPAKKLPPVSESLVLDAAHTSSLREVYSLKLNDLPECSLSTLGQCWSLRYLTVTKCGLICLDGLSQCKHLLYINAENNSIEYMDLKDLGNLQVVKLAHNKLSTIHGLEGCINVRWLDLSQNRITRISALNSLRRIHTLNLSNNQIVSSEGLEEAITLQYVDLSHNYLQHFTDISKLCLLTHLDLSCNNLLEVPELKNQVLLQCLNLQENSIRSLESLNKYWLPLLHTLSCGQNMLESVTDVSNLILLSHLDLSQNQITQMENFLPGIAQNRHLGTLLLEGNPLVDAYAEEYKQIISRAVPCLKSVDHCNVGQSETESTTEAGIKESDEIIKMCLSQMKLHFGLKTEFDTQMKVLHVNPHVTGETLCSTYFTFSDTSFKMASEHRQAHEYMDTSVSDSVSDFTVILKNRKDKFSSAPEVKSQQESRADEKNIFSINNTNVERTFSEKSSNFDILQDKKPQINYSVVRRKDKINTDLLGKNQNSMNNSSDSLTGHSSDANLKKQHQTKSSVNVRTSQEMSDVNCSPVKQKEMNYYEDSRKGKINFSNSISDSNMNNNCGPEVLSGSDRSVHDNDSVTAVHPPPGSQSLFPKGDKSEMALNKSSESIADGKMFGAKALLASRNSSDHHDQYLNGKDKFEIALQTQISNSYLAQESERTSDREYLQPVNHTKPRLRDTGGVRADVVGSQLSRLNRDITPEDIDFPAGGLEGSFDLETLGFDIDKYLDMAELDEILETGWRPSDVPQIPQSQYPVLGKISMNTRRSTNTDKGDNKDYEQVQGHPPLQPSQAWKDAQVPSELKLGLGMMSPADAPTPSSVASASETVRGGSVRSKKEELSEEWGFKDTHTAEMMLARAQKMKYKPERRRKLNKLDPQQRLHLLKKLEETYRVKPVRPISVKALPRKEYFQAREEAARQEESERQAQEHARVRHIFEWLHTQVGEYDISSSRINPRAEAVHGTGGDTFGRKDVLEGQHLRKMSPLSDHQVAAHKKGQLPRRYSTGEGQTGHTPTLPPIQTSCQPPSHKNERISFRDIPVEMSGGWGGGKKRGLRK